MLAQLAGGAFGGRSRIIQLMRQPRRKFPQARQPVSLLLDARGFANAVGHQAHQPLGQFRHFLHQLGKMRGRKLQDAAIRDRPPVTPKIFIRENGSTPVIVAWLSAKS